MPFAPGTVLTQLALSKEEVRSQRHAEIFPTLTWPVCSSLPDFSVSPRRRVSNAKNVSRLVTGRISARIPRNICRASPGRRKWRRNANSARRIWKRKSCKLTRYTPCYVYMLAITIIFVLRERRIGVWNRFRIKLCDLWLKNLTWLVDRLIVQWFAQLIDWLIDWWGWIEWASSRFNQMHVTVDVAINIVGILEIPDLCRGNFWFLGKKWWRRPNERNVALHRATALHPPTMDPVPPLLPRRTRIHREKEERTCTRKGPSAPLHRPARPPRRPVPTVPTTRPNRRTWSRWVAKVFCRSNTRPSFSDSRKNCVTIPQFCFTGTLFSWKFSHESMICASKNFGRKRINIQSVLRSDGQDSVIVLSISFIISSCRDVFVWLSWNSALDSHEWKRVLILFLCFTGKTCY